MRLIREVREMQRIVEDARVDGSLVGLVPTMGFFHEGHLALMRAAREECDLVVVSLFVNPTQFGPAEDLESYPRDLESDLRQAEGAGVDYLFSPEVEEMYPDGYGTFVEVERLSGVMCGEHRPGHFRGVATVVAKLFNIIPAHRAYFGQKDAQQLAIIRRMAADLNFPVEIVAVPTVREEDGLAMSSRNTYLDEEERARATVLYRGLRRAEEMIGSGERRAGRIRRAVEREISAEPGVRLEYVAICDNIHLEPLETLDGQVLVAVAVRVGKARLIDNMLFEIE